MTQAPASPEERGATAPRLPDWLSLAAAPSFAVMALVSAVSQGRADLLCSATSDLSPLGGMVPMYVLMSAFHLAPWLRLASARPSASARHATSFDPTAGGGVVERCDRSDRGLRTALQAMEE